MLDAKNKIIFLTAGVLVGPVGAVLHTVAEESALLAVTVTAGQEVFVANRLVRHEQRLHLPLLGQLVAVLNRVLPVAGLLLEVEGQTGRTADGLQALK